jgi:hypothetical protein
VASLLRATLPLALLLCLAPTPLKAVSTTDSRQDSQQEWVSRSKSQSKPNSKTKKRNKHKHHHHQTMDIQTTAPLSA